MKIIIFLLIFLSLSFILQFFFKSKRNIKPTEKQRRIRATQVILKILVVVISILLVLPISEPLTAFIIGISLIIIALKYFNSGVAYVQFAIIIGKESKIIHTTDIILGLFFIAYSVYRFLLIP